MVQFDSSRHEVSPGQCSIGKSQVSRNPWNTYIPCHIPFIFCIHEVPYTSELASFKKGIKRETSAYLILKDECYFDKFQRDLCITAKSHDVSEILDPTFPPGPSQEKKELFEAKQVFMYKVFNETSFTDMGRTKVRKHRKTSDAQAVWKEYSEYMATASEKRKLTHYMTNTVLDSQFRGTSSSLSYISMNNSGDWMNSQIYLKGCLNLSRWHSFRMQSRISHNSALLRP